MSQTYYFNLNWYSLLNKVDVIGRGHTNYDIQITVVIL